MNRRNFFKGLAALVGGAAAPMIFVPKLDPVRWKVLGPSGLLVPNPAWIDAPYELLFIHPDVGYWSQELLIHPRNIELTDPKKVYPVRYALRDPETFMPVEIPPFIKQ